MPKPADEIALMPEQPPSLQALVLTYGTWDKIPQEAWRTFQAEMAEWKAKVRYGELGMTGGWSQIRWKTSRHWYTVPYDKAQCMHSKGFEVRQHQKGHWQVLCTWQDLDEHPQTHTKT